MSEKYQRELFILLEDYADFLAQMVRDEEDKLSALISGSLPRIESILGVAQANAKKMESFEMKRIRLQEQAGYGGMNFTQMIECAPEEEQQSLEALLRQIQDTVDNIKYQNSKSMNVARVNMMEINPAAELPGMNKNPASSVYRQAAGKNKEHHSMLETKI